MVGMNSIKKFIKDGREAAAKAVIKVFHSDLASGESKNAGNPFFETCVQEHEKELGDWTDPYGYWLRSDPWEKMAAQPDETKISFGEYEYVYLCTEKAYPSHKWKIAVKEALDALSELSCEDKDKSDCSGQYPEVAPVIIYGDEDEAERDGANGLNCRLSSSRRNPFFKPDFSPELFEQFNYLGELVLIRKDIFEKAGFDPEKYASDAPDPDELYRILQAVSAYLPKASFDERAVLSHLYKGVLHVPHILSHRIEGKVSELYERCLETSEENSQLFESSLQLPSVSVIIPSKDHPEVLKTCISSFFSKTVYARKVSSEGDFTVLDREKIEIIVVDNGSAPDKKKEYEALSTEYGFDYIYDPQPFNYSHMNNIGIEKASGELVLLLNDDTEIIRGDWLEKMAMYAMRPEVGAVGAKLLYAETDKIQHAGVTNLAVGPSHKLLALSDSEDYYFGRNKLDYNMLAVTGACLMVSRSKLSEVSGLNEDLKVAYNDMDLCFKLFEKGYRSVQCNGAVLYHYESLTRGLDEGSEEKYKRLLEEKEKLYGYHAWAKGFDPFYNPNLIDNSADYLPATKDCTRNTDSFSGLLGKLDFLPKETFMVRTRLDRVQKQLRNTEKDKDFIWLDGWAFVRGCDNRRFGKTLILKDAQTGEIRQYELFSTYRKDILAAFSGENHIELAGFYFRLPAEELGQSEWNAGILLTDCVTGKKLYKDFRRAVTANG